MKNQVLLISCMALFCACDSSKSTDQITNDTQVMAQITATTVLTTNDSFEAPDSLQAGYHQINYTNQTNELHSAHLIKIKEGYTAEQMIQAYADSSKTGGPRPDWMIHRGGVIAANGEGSTTLLIEPGEYTWVCVMGDAAPHFAGYENQPVTVYGEVNENEVLEAATATINMTDTNHQIDQKIKAGEARLDIINTGDKYHLVAISKLNEGATKEEALTWYQTMQGPPPFSGLTATSAIGPSLKARIEMNFEKGTYLLYCMANAEGTYHMMEGAFSTFEVK